jgi:hypothetical protein
MMSAQPSGPNGAFGSKANLQYNQFNNHLNSPQPNPQQQQQQSKLLGALNGASSNANNSLPTQSVSAAAMLAALNAGKQQQHQQQQNQGPSPDGNGQHDPWAQQGSTSHLVSSWRGRLVVSVIGRVTDQSVRCLLRSSPDQSTISTPSFHLFYLTNSHYQSRNRSTTLAFPLE